MKKPANLAGFFYGLYPQIMSHLLAFMRHGHSCPIVWGQSLFGISRCLGSVAKGVLFDLDDGLGDVVQHGFTPCQNVDLRHHAGHDFNCVARPIQNGGWCADFGDKDLVEELADLKNAFAKYDFKKEFNDCQAKLNKWLLPSLSKRDFDLSKATKLQMALIGWRYYVTKNSLD